MWMLRRNYVVLVKSLLHLPRLPESTVRCAMLAETEASSLAKVEPTMTEAEVRQRWQGGEECLVARIDDRIVGFHWDAMRSLYLEYIGRTLVLRKGETYAGYTYTHPDFRGRGLHPYISLAAQHRARDRGAHRSIALVAAWNQVTIRNCVEKLDRKIEGSIGYWNFALSRNHFTRGNVRLDGEGGFRTTD